LLANADQGGLFDFGDSHAASTNEPELVPTEPWTLKERLSLEKTAIGFYLSGHLFDEAEAGGATLCQASASVISRQPRSPGGGGHHQRTARHQRHAGAGRPSSSSMTRARSIEAVANQDTLDANKDLLKDDELVIIQARCRRTASPAGLRLNVQQVFSLAAARCRYARFVRVLAKDQKLPVADILREFPARQIEAPQPDLPPTVQGLPIRVVVERRTLDVSARAEVELGDKARLFPSDQALQRFKELMPEGQAMVVYGEG
jgi:DNA polymerase-3 subunit alpha